MRVLPAA